MATIKLIINKMNNLNSEFSNKDEKVCDLISTDCPKTSPQQEIVFFSSFNEIQADNEQHLFANNGPKIQRATAEFDDERNKFSEQNLQPIIDYQDRMLEQFNQDYSEQEKHCQYLNEFAQPNEQGKVHSMECQDISIAKTIQCPNVNEIVEQSVFKEFKIRKRTTKNTNIPKFIVKTFRDVMNEDLKQHKSITNEYFTDALLDKSLRKILSSISGKGQNQFKTDDLIKIFGSRDSVKRQLRAANRGALRKILRTMLRSEIIQNRNMQEENKLTYLIASKVYALRCMRAQLISRIQSK